MTDQARPANPTRERPRKKAWRSVWQPGAVAWVASPPRSPGSSMSRRPSDPSDLRPGNEPDASPRPGTNGRPPTPPPGWRPDSNRPPERPTGSSGPGGSGDKPSGSSPSSPSLRWVPWVVLALIAAAFLVSTLANSGSSKNELTFSQFTKAVESGEVKGIEYNKSTGAIDGTFRQPVNGDGRIHELGTEGQPPDLDAQAAHRAERRPQVRRQQQQPLHRHPAVGACHCCSSSACSCGSAGAPRGRWARS